MFKNKYRIHSAWAKGLMLGKAVGARDERDRITDLLENDFWHDIYFAPSVFPELPTKTHKPDCLGCEIVAQIWEKTND